MDCFQKLRCFSEPGRRRQTLLQKMSKSARSQSFPRSQKPIPVRHEGFFSRLKRRLRISSKKSYSIGESLEGIASTGQYMPRSSVMFNESQMTDPISYSDMGHNLARSVQGTNQSGSSITRVRAESCNTEAESTVLASQSKARANGVSPKIFSASEEELAHNAFVLSEENAVDLDDNVFVRNSYDLEDKDIPEIMEEPGYETLDEIQKQIKDKKSGKTLGTNSTENCGGIAVKTDFQKGEDTGSIRGQMSKTSLDSGLGSPEQGTQSPNLESEGECSESIACSSSGVKMGTQMVRSFHTVQGAPSVVVTQIGEDDIYANAQIPMRKKSVKKSQNEPDSGACDSGDSETVNNPSGSAPGERDSAVPPPLPERCYSAYGEDAVAGSVPAGQEENLELSRNTSIPPPLPDRKYSTSDLVGMENLERGDRDISKFSDNGKKIAELGLAEESSVSATRGSSGGLSSQVDRGEGGTAHCALGEGSVPGNCDKNNCGACDVVKGSLTVAATSSVQGVSKVGEAGSGSGSNGSRNHPRPKLRQGSRRNDKTVVEVSFGAVKLKEEEDVSSTGAGSKSDKNSLVCSGGGTSEKVAVLSKSSSLVTGDSVKAASASCSGNEDTTTVTASGGGVVGGDVAQHAVVPKKSFSSSVNPPMTGKSGEKSAVTSAGKASGNSDSDCTGVPLPISSGCQPLSSAVHMTKPRSVAAQCVTVGKGDVSQDTEVSHSVLRRTVDPADSNPASDSQGGAKTTGCVPLKATNESSQHPVSTTLSNHIAESEANQDGARSAESLAQVATADTMCCNSLDRDDLYRDDEPIHMSLQEVFGADFEGGNPAMSERVTKRKSRMQINSDDILAFQESMQQLKECGWYWGPLSSNDAELKLANKPDGSFLVRDSANENYILSITFKSSDRVHHTRIEHFKGKFSFWSQPESHGKNTIKEFIDQAMENSRNGQFKYFLRAQGPGMPPVSMYLLYPVSRFKTMRSLMHMCRFTILQIVRRDHVDCLPIPLSIKKYLKEHQYYAEIIDDDADDVVGFDQNDNHSTQL